MVVECAVDVRIAADSTMLRMVNLLIALSLGVQREQLEQRIGLTWPRPFLLRPLRALLAGEFGPGADRVKSYLEALFLTILTDSARVSMIVLQTS